MKRLLILLLCFMLPFSAFAEPFRVYDNAELFTAEEEITLENAIKEYRWETKTDFAILTTDDFLGENNQLVIASEFYDAMNFGIAQNKDGLIFYIDMKMRAPAISTCGSVIRLMTDEKLDRVFDAVTPLLSEGKYAEAMLTAIQEATKIHEEYWKKYISE